MTPFPDDYPVRPRQERTSLWPLVMVLALVLLGLVIWRWWPGEQRPLLDPQAMPRAVVRHGDLPPDEQAVVDLFESASQSVVNITTSSIRRDALTLNLHEIPKGTGSGFVWDAEKGYIVTNYHVVEETGSGGVIRVALKDESSWIGTLVGGAPDYDLAVIQIKAPAAQLRQLPIGESHNLKVGQKVFAIGNPFGLDQSLSMGIISALNREIRTSRSIIKGVIQTDAAINPGNSGGPLLDSFGLLIGVNTAIASPTGAYAGIGFAIPVDTVNRVVPQIIRRGRVGRPALGISIVDPRLARRWGIRSGVVVMDVTPNGPAAKAGLQQTRIERGGDLVVGDVIVAVDGQAIASPDHLLEALADHQVGDSVQLTILRGGQRMTITVELGEI